MAEQIDNKPKNDPLSKEERALMAAHERGELMYVPDDRELLDALCGRALLEIVEGEFIQELVDGPGRIRLSHIYRITDAGHQALGWTP